MPAPVAQIPPDLAIYLQELEDRIAVLENPQEPIPVPSYATADMPSAAIFTGRVIINTTLNIMAHSDGANWRREDTGAVI